MTLIIQAIQDSVNLFFLNVPCLLIGLQTCVSLICACGASVMWHLHHTAVYSIFPFDLDSPFCPVFPLLAGFHSVITATTKGDSFVCTGKVALQQTRCTTWAKILIERQKK